jgi:chorismate synthase
MSNSFGKFFCITGFGESHGPVVGVIIDGCPAGLPLTEEDIQQDLEKRKSISGAGQTARMEPDKVEILSGVFKQHTTGAPIALLLRNLDTDSTQYERIRFLPRPGHADYTAFRKYGGYNDYRGGGRFSGRTTASLVMAGAVARKVLRDMGIEILAHTIQIGNIKDEISCLEDIRSRVYHNPLRCANENAGQKMLELIREVEQKGDSIGGIIEGLALNVPAGLGEPCFDTLEGELAKALFAIPAVKGVDFGSGFTAAGKRGSENNDPFVMHDGKVFTKTNNAGGVLGGISSGMPLVVRVAVKPTPSISQKQPTVDLQSMQNAEITISGRHDVCLVPRAVIVVESMMAVTLCDFAIRAGLLPKVMK